MKTRIGTSASALIVGIFSFSTLLSAQVRITAVTPAAAQPGATVTITGNTFPAGVVAANVTANFAPVTNGAGPTVNAPLNTLVTVFGTTRRAVLTLPVGLVVAASTPYNVTLSSASPAFTTALAGNITINPTATLLSANPASGRLTQTIDVALTGSFSNFFQGVTTADFGAGINSNSVTVATPTSATANITITAGAAPGVRNISVTTGSEALTLSNGFTVNPAPAVLSANPNSGTVGNTLDVVLTGSGSTWLNGLGVLEIGRAHV